MSKGGSELRESYIVCNMWIWCLTDYKNFQVFVIALSLHLYGELLFSNPSSTPLSFGKVCAFSHRLRCVLLRSFSFPDRAVFSFVHSLLYA